MNTRSENATLQLPRIITYGFCEFIPAYCVLTSRLIVIFPDWHSITCVPPEAGPPMPMSSCHDGMPLTAVCASVGFAAAASDIQEIALPDHDRYFFATSHAITISVNAVAAN